MWSLGLGLRLQASGRLGPVASGLEKSRASELRNKGVRASNGFSKLGAFSYMGSVLCWGSKTKP